MKENWEKPEINNLELKDTQTPGAKMTTASPERTLIVLGITEESTSS